MSYFKAYQAIRVLFELDKILVDGTIARLRVFMRFSVLAIALILFISCTNSDFGDTDLMTETNNDKSKQNLPSKNRSRSELNEFTITMKLCEDESGPDCAKLRLGDDFLTTSKPAKGFLYSCVEKDPNAPGAISEKITWIDLTEVTWNLFKKLWLPGGTFQTGKGFYVETVKDNEREIRINNLPVDEKIGDWPMTNYPSLTKIDPNPGIPDDNDLSLYLPLEPVQADSPTCLSSGSIGITKNGVVIFNAADARGEDAVAREIVDEFGGHPARYEYHYHFIPERLDHNFTENGHSGIVGYIKDGFPIHGYRGDGGIEMSNSDLDPCHGHQHDSLGYHYHATLEYPYTVGCYMGTPISDKSTEIMPNLPRPVRPSSRP